VRVRVPAGAHLTSQTGCAPLEPRTYFIKVYFRLFGLVIFRVFPLYSQVQRSRSKVKVKGSRSRSGSRSRPDTDSEHAECGGVQNHNVQSSTPTLVKSAKPQAGVQAKNRRTFKVISAEIAEFKIDPIPIGCPPPRSSFLGLSAFCPTIHDNLCAYLLLYWVPLPQISAIRRPIVTKLCGHDEGLIIY